VFELFDPQSEFTIREGKLPHWCQLGVTYFVTMRTEDSVPASVADTWRIRRDQWLLRQDISISDSNWKVRLAQHPLLYQEFHAEFTREFMAYLDRGYGACRLRDPAISTIVASSLGHFDGVRYLLGDYVVMPNHLHVIVCLLGTTEIEAQCRSWKRFTARRINETIGRCGRFWQEESFDHLVRSPQQFEYLQRYIRDNPVKANLREGDFLYRPSNKSFVE